MLIWLAELALLLHLAALWAALIAILWERLQ